MKKFKNTFIAVGATVVAASMLLSACGSSASTPASGSTDASGELKIEVIAKGFQHDFWKAVAIGADKAGKEFGAKVNFVGPEGEGAIQSQVEMINNAINKNPSAICLASLDTNAAIDAINKAKNANIPIIGFDSGVPDAPEGAIHANASTDNYAAGALAAEKLYEGLNGKISSASDAVRIGVVSQEANSQSITQRTSGFIDKMISLIGGDVAVIGHDKFANNVSDSKVTIEVRIPAEITDAAGKTEAQALLEKSDLIAIYGSNEFAAKAIINANEGISGGRIGADKVLAVGFDAGALQLDAISNKLFYGSVTQDPVAIGYQAVKLAIAAAKGESVADVDTGAQWYNADNMNDENIKPLLYK